MWSLALGHCTQSRDLGHTGAGGTRFLAGAGWMARFRGSLGSLPGAGVKDVQQGEGGAACSAQRVKSGAHKGPWLTGAPRGKMGNKGTIREPAELCPEPLRGVPRAQGLQAASSICWPWAGVCPES